MSHISWRGEQNTIYKGVEIFPYQTRFKALRGSPKGKAQKRQYSLLIEPGNRKEKDDDKPTHDLLKGQEKLNLGILKGRVGQKERVYGQVGYSTFFIEITKASRTKPTSTRNKSTHFQTERSTSPHLRA